MKLKRLLIVLLAVISSVMAILSLTACEAKVDKDGNVTITDGDKSGDNNNGGSGDESGGTGGDNSGSQGGDETGGEQGGSETGDDSQDGDKKRSEGLRFILNSDKTEYALAGAGVCEDVDIIVPSTYKNKPVTAVSENAFINCATVYSIVLPNSVTSIGNSAFNGCVGLKTIEFSENLKTIGNSAFNGCESLIEINLPDSLVSIGNAAFWNCVGLKTIKFSENLKSIGDEAFYRCATLKNLIIPDSVTNIGEGAFIYCSSLDSVTIGKGVESPVFGVFLQCAVSRIYIEKNAVSLDGDWGFDNWQEPLDVYYGGSIDEWVETRGASALNLYCKMNLYCDGVSSGKAFITTAKAIKNGVFFSALNITEVNIGASVETVEKGAFGCYNLKNINVASENKDYCSSNGILYNKGKTEIISVPSRLEGKITIPGSVNKIDDQCFEYRNITDIVIEDGVTDIGQSVFKGCSSLESVIIPDTVKSVGYGIFAECESLTNLTTPVVLVKSEDGEDSGFSIMSIFGLTKINLVNVTITSENYIYGFSNCASIKCVKIKEGAKIIGSRAFSGCTSLENIIIPDSISTIEYDAFSYCTSLKSINIPDSVKTLGESIFAYCSALKNIKIGDDVTDISSYFFHGCTSLESVTINSGVTSIGEKAFYGCNSLTMLNYNGTIEQWIQMNKDNDWNFSSSITSIKCSDGTINL